MSKMREAWFGIPDVNPTLRDLAASETSVDQARSEYEDRVGALLPGDDPTEHLFHSEPNPYLFLARPVLWGLLRDAVCPKRMSGSFARP